VTVREGGQRRAIWSASGISMESPTRIPEAGLKDLQRSNWLPCIRREQFLKEEKMYNSQLEVQRSPFPSALASLVRVAAAKSPIVPAERDEVNTAPNRYSQPFPSTLGQPNCSCELSPFAKTH
jgi:hypothetical protein